MKAIISIAKDLFKYVEVLCRSVIIPVGSTDGLIVNLGGLMRKYLISCQISSSKVILVCFDRQ